MTSINVADYLAMLSGCNDFGLVRRGPIGGLTAFGYFFTVILWTPVSREMPLMDRPLRFAA